MKHKIELIKTILRHEISLNKVLVLSACENEMYCFEAYLKQRKDILLNMPTESLENLIRGLDLQNNRKVA